MRLKIFFIPFLFLTLFFNVALVSAEEESTTEKLYLIQDGVVNTELTGGFSSTQLAGTSGRSLQHYTYSADPPYYYLYTGLWSETTFVSNNTIPFTDYEKIVFDYEYGIQQYGSIYLYADSSFSDSGRWDTQTIIVQNDNRGRQTLKINLPSPIPSTMDKFYSKVININPSMKVYNLYLEREVQSQEEPILTSVDMHETNTLLYFIAFILFAFFIYFIFRFAWRFIKVILPI